MKTKLIPMTDFVKDILSYVNESQSHERAIQLIEWYSDLISLPLKIDMFEGDNPLFPDFKVVEYMRDLNGNLASQVVLPCEHDFTVILYRRSEYSTAKDGMCFIATYNLKKVEDLCSMQVLINRSSEYAESELFHE